jgi:hypothetical protein
MVAMPSSTPPPSSATPATARPSGQRSGELVTLNGATWQKLGEYPRVVADSLRQMLASEGSQSALLTPWGWVFQTCAIELHTGIYSGSVGLYVPAEQAGAAWGLLEQLGLPLAQPAPASAKEREAAAPVPGLGRLRRFPS